MRASFVYKAQSHDNYICRLLTSREPHLKANIPKEIDLRFASESGEAVLSLPVSHTKNNSREPLMDNTLGVRLFRFTSSLKWFKKFYILYFICLNTG